MRNETNAKEKITSDNLFSTTSPPPPENRAVYEIIWKNISEPDK
jgi:hypothetical protein